MGNEESKVLHTEYDEKGREKAHVILEKPGKTDEMFIAPNQAIPVIFVPGIMGSPLIATGDNTGLWKSQGKWAWFPDDKAWVVNGYGNRAAHIRKLLLDPTKTKAVETPKEADEDTLKATCEGHPLPWQEAARRGWGSVMLTSYGDVLHFLENQLRFVFYQGNPYPGTYQAVPHDPNQWGELKGYKKLTDEDLRKAAAWRFPVYAVGYNWMDSNAVAADYLKRRIDAIRKDCRERLKVKCDKVILVTHSMGGLVARLCAKRYPEDILGVVHGVQPAIGAGTAYARVRGGWDSNTHLTHPLDSVASIVGAWALGGSGEEVSAVFASGAGPLELLPNQLYGTGWLTVKYGLSESSATTLLTLPEKDPYDEIYAETKGWWRLIHPACLVIPEERKDPSVIRGEWIKYTAQLSKAKSFHHELGSYYHPKTFAHCGDDRSQQAWHNVSWRLEPLRDGNTGLTASNNPSSEAIRNADLTTDVMRGSCEIHDSKSAGNAMYSRNGEGVSGYYAGDYYRAWLSGKDNSGDATVPSHSGLAPRPHVPFFARMNGFDHQGSYQKSDVQAVTLYSILSLAVEATRHA